jgi:hypothetical protein
LALTLSLGAAFVPANTPAAQADPGVTSWEKFPTPRPGSLSDYILVEADGGSSDWFAGPGPFEKGVDGSLYVYWDVGENTLYTSLLTMAVAGSAVAVVPHPTFFTTRQLDAAG